MKDWSTRRSTARVLAIVAGIAVSVTAGAATLDSSRRFEGRALPADRAALALESPAAVEGIGTSTVHPSLAGATGTQQVIVRLGTPSVADGATSRGAVAAEQSLLMSRIAAVAPGARQIGAVQMVLNAIFLEVDGADLPKIGRVANVSRVAPVSNYRRDLADTVPYVGARTVQQLGYTGQRVRVAVLDAGIDYTHVAFGGAGTAAAYQAAYGTDRTGAKAASTDGLFPTAKVIGGFDFVGEAWPAGALAPDPDPIAAPDVPVAGYCTTDCFGGHGTHVADIIGGSQGVAPGVKLYGVKVCASYATSCSGVALIEGMDWAIDPNQDGNTNDRADIINMSLGSDYGTPFDDDLSQAVEGATKFGTLTVASAGNGGDKPYITGTPASAPSALSVAQTAMPKASLPLMTIVGAANPNRPAIQNTWSPLLTTKVTDAVVYAASNPLACTPFTADQAAALAGKIVLVNRGTCSASIKGENLSLAGAKIGIIGFVDGSAPFAFAYGGGTITIPVYSISLADANAIRGGATVTFDPTNTLPLAGSLASTSSRGPQAEGNTLKPEIGAPGASISASSGTGNGVASFGGTSGAAPMVSGAAALLKSARPGLTPAQLKQLLVNTAETSVRAPSVPGGLVPNIQAPVSRIGGGELNVARAVASPIQVYDTDSKGRGGLSFGFVDAWKDQTVINKTLAVENFGRTSLTLNVAAAIGDHADGDAATGAVSISAPATVTVGPRATVRFPVQLRIDGAKLRDNRMNGGSLGANPQVLTTQEYDGYITLSNSSAKVQLPWHVLPRKSARVKTDKELEIGPDGTGVIVADNTGVGAAQYAAYSLLGTGVALPAGAAGTQSPSPGIRAVGVTTFDATGLCSAGYAFEFGVANFNRLALPMPTSNIIFLDTNGDGVDDYAVLSRDLSFNNITDGRQLSWVLNLATGAANADFFVGHPTNASNTSMLVCAERLGLKPGDILNREITVSAFAQPFYYGGPGGEAGPWKMRPFGEKYVVLGDDTPGNSVGELTVLRFDDPISNPEDAGVLLFTNSGRSSTNNGGATADTEVLVIKDEPEIAE